MGSSRLPTRIGRREFLATPLLLAAGAAGYGCRSRNYRPADFARPGRSPVALFAVSSYAADLEDVIYRGLVELKVTVAGKHILLKPNLVEYESGTCINTHASVVGAAARALLKAGAATVSVGEGPGHRRDTEYLLVGSGLWDHLRDLGVSFTDLNRDDVRPTPLRSWFTGERQLLLPASVLDADLVVSLPKLKTHHWAGMTCAMKNLFGTVPGAVYGWPKNRLHHLGIPQSIVDLAATIRPGLSIVDGITAMEGDGPIMGTPRALGLLAMGTDPVAVDATCARIIGLDPAKMDYLRAAGEFLGHSAADRIVHRGERPERFATRFRVVKHLEALCLGE